MAFKIFLPIWFWCDLISGVICVPIHDYDNGDDGDDKNDVDDDDDDDKQWNERKCIPLLKCIPQHEKIIYFYTFRI